MADWRDNLQKVTITGSDGKPKIVVGGSFRGVPFFVESHEFSGGRRKVDHEFPERNVSRTEDLGRKIRDFSIECFVLGDDYFDKRDALLDALEQEGPGELIHPYLGRKNVQVGPISLSETVREGRIARFTIDFTETGEAQFPDQAVDNKQAVIAAADAANESSKGFFETIFSVAQQAAHVINGATKDLDDSLTFMEDSVTKFTDPIDSVSFAISEFKAANEALVRAPGELAERIFDTFALLFTELSELPDILQLILGNFIGLQLDPVIGSTPSRIRQTENQNAILNIFKQQAHANEAKAAVEIEYTSTNEAVRVRDGIVEQLDLQLQVAGIDDDLFQDIKDIQSSIVKTLPPPSTGTIIEFTPPKTLSAIVISYSLFKSLEKEDEIVEQNGVEHPGFVPGGVPIEVSSG